MKRVNAQRESTHVIRTDCLVLDKEFGDSFARDSNLQLKRRANWKQKKRKKEKFVLFMFLCLNTAHFEDKKMFY